MAFKTIAITHNGDELDRKHIQRKKAENKLHNLALKLSVELLQLVPYGADVMKVIMDEADSDDNLLRVDLYLKNEFAWEVDVWEAGGVENIGKNYLKYSCKEIYLELFQEGKNNIKAYDNFYEWLLDKRLNRKRV